MKNMALLSVFAVSVSFATESATMKCANNTTVSSKPIIGPNGISAFVKIKSQDDHGKETHFCMAEFTLVIVSPKGVKAEHNITNSDAEWDRALEVSLLAFSKDGSEITGTLTENGKYATSSEFVYALKTDTIKMSPLDKKNH